jgi:hypothetical protein
MARPGRPVTGPILPQKSGVSGTWPGLGGTGQVAEAQFSGTRASGFREIECELTPHGAAHEAGEPRHRSGRYKVENAFARLGTLEDDPIFGKAVVELLGASGVERDLLTAHI